MNKDSIKTKLYVFIFSTILIISISTSIINYCSSIKKINDICKNTTSDNARNFVSTLDGDKIKKIKDVIMSDEYQEIMTQAKDSDNEQLIEDYLKDQNVWEDFISIQNNIDEYLTNVTGIKYLYIIDYQTNKNNDKYIYLIDDGNEKLYKNGSFDKREKELLGQDLSRLKEPIITKSEFGWICSDYKPIYDSDNNCVAIVGCDVSMDNIMEDRYDDIKVLIAINLGLSLFIFVGGIFFINRLIIRPLKLIENEIKSFKPDEYDESDIRDLKLVNNEIGRIYENIQLMQYNIINYLKEKEQVKHDMEIKDKQINMLNKQTYKDILTNVGNKYAYSMKAKKITGPFAIVMADINNLKQVNDEFGHKSGDEYIKGCCMLICEAFKHSPVYRIGGDEFVIVLQGTDYDNRNEIINNLREIFKETYNQPKASLKEKYSVSLGIADGNPGEPVDIVFKKADELMYKEKEAFKEKYGRYR